MSLTKDLKHWFARRIALHRGQLNPQPVLDLDTVAGALERSKVPVVFIMVLVWTVSITLLTVSAVQQRRHFDWIIGQNAPLTMYAKVSFSYSDPEAAARRRESARSESPEFFRIVPQRSQEIERRLIDFVNAVRAGRAPQSAGTAGPQTSQISPALRTALMDHKRDYRSFLDTVHRVSSQGVISRQLKANRISTKMVRIIDSENRQLQLRELGMIPDPDVLAQMLERTLFGPTGWSDSELREQLATLIGPEGNLVADEEATAAAADNAEQEVDQDAEVIHVAKNEVMIHRGELYTASVQAMFNAEEMALQKQGSAGLRDIYTHLAWSSILLLAMIFFLFRFTPPDQRDSRNVFITGCVIVLALLANYGSIQLFLKAREFSRSLEYEYLFAAVPVALCGALLSVLVGVRNALFASALVCSISAMMVMPTRSFELALRWFSISTAVSLMVSGVTNYRAYFFRCFGSVFLTTLLVSIDKLMEAGIIQHEILLHTLSTFTINSFCVSVLALLLVFAFELIFNVNTNMSLMVLCSTSHPLLERLKREANGTMYHSLTVATLAEDAAREIGVNALRVKAAALFHDVGKLIRAPYFTENNPKSGELHAKHTPQFSSMIIRDHVKEGLALAKKYRLGRLIKEGIATHHGSDLIRSFYAKAKEEQAKEEGSAPVRENQFRYQGVPPKSKELTILSLADPCEAACRSLEGPSPEKIREVVTNIFVQRLLGGQLSRSDLTLSELGRIRESFVSTLVGLHHSRVAYPEEEKRKNG